MKKSQNTSHSDSYEPSNKSWQESHKLAVEADQSLIRSLAKLQETQEIKDQTLSMLKDQDKKIRKAERSMNKIHKDLDESDRTLRTTKSSAGAIVNFFKSDKSKEREQMNETPILKKESPISKKEDEKKPQKHSSSTPIIFESGNPHAQAINVYSLEMDRKLDCISDTLSIFKKDAITQGEMLDYQNQRLRNLGNDTDFANDREESSTHKTRNI